jgi:hypothetical protein
MNPHPIIAVFTSFSDAPFPLIEPTCNTVLTLVVHVPDQLGDRHFLKEKSAPQTYSIEYHS